MTVTQLQLRRGTASQCAAMTPAAAEPIVDTTNTSIRVGDGTTAGGWLLAVIGKAAAFTTLASSGLATLASLAVTGAVTLSGAITYGGVTLSNAVTGLGKMVLDTAPTISAPVITGHATIEGVTPTGASGSGAIVFATAPALSNPTVTTQAFADSSTKAASTAFVQSAIAGAATGTVASASTTDLSTSPLENQIVSGNVSITSFGAGANLRRLLVFTGHPVLTYNATSLITPTGADIQAASGDAALLISDASANWRIVSYLPAGGVIQSSFTNQNMPTSFTHLASVALTPGKWRLSAELTFNGTTSATYLTFVLSTTADTVTNSWPSSPRIDGAISAAGAGGCALGAVDVTVSANTTWYMNVAGQSGSTGGLNGKVRAERIY